MALMNPKQKDTLTKAKVYFDEGKIELAFPLLNSLLSQEAVSDELYHLLASIHYERGQFKKAITFFKRALQINPDFTESAIGLSVILNDLGKYEEAQEVFKTAQRRLKKKGSSKQNLNTDIAQKHWELAELYAKNSQIVEALENIISYEKIMGESSSSVLKKARLLKESSKFSLASKILREWAGHQSVSADFLAELAELYYLDRKPLAALSTCEEALELDPHHDKLLKLNSNLKKTTFDLRT